MKFDRSAARRKVKKPKPSRTPKRQYPVKPDQDFYRSLKWKQLRYLVLRNSGGCNCCGAKASDGVQLHVDHIKPRFRFPELELSLDNLQVLCEDCNVGKGSWDSTDWRYP